MPIDVSVIIPTRGRPRKAAACVRALADQTLPPDRYEVLIGLDGAQEATRRSVTDAWPAGRQDTLSIVTCPREGLNAARNRLLPRARGRTLVSLNDDVCPEPGFLAAHAEAQQTAGRAGAGAIVVGHSPWVRPRCDRLFDRLVRETSMVFFYNRMTGDDPDRDWGYRHAWGLNVSMPAGAMRRVGGWTAVPREYGYDDIEVAWRLSRRFDFRVLYRPAARAPHDHRMAPRDYLEREFRLGRAAWHFARANPGFARDLFGRDIAGADELAWCRASVERERGHAARTLTSFERLAALPASAVDGDHAGAIIELVYEQHLPLKRWMWRAGLLDAAAGGAGEVAWPDAGRSAEAAA